MIGIEKEKKIWEENKLEMCYRSSSVSSKRRVVHDVRAVVQRLGANGVSSGVARTVVRPYDQTTCRSYVANDLSFE